MNAPYEALVADKPELVIHEGNLPATVTGLRRVMAAAGDIFDRDGIVVRMVAGSSTGQPKALPLSHHAVVMETHQHCRPVRINADGKTIAATLPERVARMYLDSGGWGLPSLVGIATEPLLASDGTIRTAQGYDPKTGLWCVPSPSLVVPPHPTEGDAKAALVTLRHRFRTFPFADAHMEFEDKLAVVAQDKPPGLAESSFLASLMTAVCRPSLYLAPGLLVNAPLVTGAGSGKGKLVRAIAAIAFGVPPGAVTMGHEKAELDKRLVAELISARPMVFLDNVNGTALRSDLLASILTERPARARVLGLSRMAELNCTAFIATTGNGLSVSEDLARRFLAVNLDPKCEDPEARPFVGNVLAEIQRDRVQLLTAALTIWRWGRLATLPRGLPLGSYETWAEWCRDPLVALGCADPVLHIRNAKANDPQRRAVADLFTAWWAAHGAIAVKAAELSSEVMMLLDPHKRGRQWMVQRLQQLIGTRGGGFVLTHQPPASGGKTGSTYALRQTASEAQRHPAPQSPDSPHRDERG